MGETSLVDIRIAEDMACKMQPCEDSRAVSPLTYNSWGLARLHAEDDDPTRARQGCGDNPASDAGCSGSHAPGEATCISCEVAGMVAIIPGRAQVQEDTVGKASYERLGVSVALESRNARTIGSGYGDAKPNQGAGHTHPEAREKNFGCGTYQKRKRFRVQDSGLSQRGLGATAYQEEEECTAIHPGGLGSCVPAGHVRKAMACSSADPSVHAWEVHS